LEFETLRARWLWFSPECLRTFLWPDQARADSGGARTRDTGADSGVAGYEVAARQERGAEGGLPLSGWLLLIALVYGSLQQGAFHGDQFRLVLLLVGVAGVAHWRGATRRPSDRRLVPACAVVVFGAIGLTVLTTDADLGSAAPTLALAAAVLVTIAVGASLPDATVVRVVDGVIVCGLLASATAWIGVAFHRQPWGLVVQDIWRGSSTLTYANATAALAGMALLLALGRLRPEAHRLAFLPAYGLGLGVLCTGSRAGALSVAVGLSVLARRAGWQSAARSLVPVAAACLVAGLGLLPSIAADSPARPGLAVGGVVLGALVGAGLSGVRRPAWPSLLLGVAGVAIVASTAWAAVDDLGTARFDFRSEDRAAEWAAATDQLRGSPVFGVGPGRLNLSWVDADGQTVVAEFAHNEYLELLATHGLVGAGALIACVALVASARRARPRPSVIEDGVVAALAVLAVHSAFDFLWHIPVVVLASGLLAGVLASGPADLNPEKEALP
jgi:O-antigen ligase